MTSLSKYRITMNTSQLRNETSQLRNKHVTNLIIEHEVPDFKYIGRRRQYIKKINRI